MAADKRGNPKMAHGSLPALALGLGWITDSRFREIVV